MFISHVAQANPAEVNAKAAALGLKLGETEGSRQTPAKPAIGGNTFAIKDLIKAAGGRFDGFNKCWTFDSYEATRSFVMSL